VNKVAFVVAGLLLGALVDAQGRAQHYPSQPGVQSTPQAQTPIVLNCWREPHYFSSLKTGDMTYCREHLRYTPGAMECYVFEAEVCSVFQPGFNQVTQTRQELPPIVIECPEEPAPPLCPRNRVLRR
jgi:hypothetical protein